jgi:hypothetical protein
MSYSSEGRNAVLAPWTGAAGIRLGVGLAALPPILYALMPRPPISGAHFLMVPVIAGVLGIFVLLFLRVSTEVYSRLVLLPLLLLLLNVSVAASFLLNAPELRIAATAELLRPAVFLIFLVFGYQVAFRCGERDVIDGLLIAAKLILVAQAVIAAAQLAGLPIFDFVYSAHKARPLGTIVRVTGSMGNPNIFGWIVAQACVTVFLLGRRRWPWLLLGCILIFAAGSRTLLVLFPCMMALVGVWRRGGGWWAYARGSAIAAAAVAAAVLLALSLSQYLPYLGQLRDVVISGSLSSVNSFAYRLYLWDAAYYEFRSGGLGTWILGLGSRESTRVLDNDFLYVFFRLGVSGFLLHSGILLYMTYLLRKARGHAVALLGMQYLLFSLALGLMYETLGGWNFPLTLFYLVGLAAGVARRAQPMRSNLPEARRYGVSVARA